MYLAAAEDSRAAAGHIHAGISAKDAIVTALTGSTAKGKDHATAARELKQALGQRPDAATAESLGRRAGTLVELAVQVVRLGR